MSIFLVWKKEEYENQIALVLGSQRLNFQEITPTELGDMKAEAIKNTIISLNRLGLTPKELLIVEKSINFFIKALLKKLSGVKA